MESHPRQVPPSAEPHVVDVPAAMSSQGPVELAIISDVPTPYRVHVLKRIASELREVKLHSLFTHASDRSAVQWDMQLDPAINPVFFNEVALSPNEHATLRTLRLFNVMRDYLIRHRVRIIILLGYNDLARMRLIRWARKAGIPLLVTGDSNVFAEGRLSPLKRLVKRVYVRWSLRSIAGLMPMGTAGRAFYRLYADHELPTFLFPYEPDYETIQRRDEEKERAFRAGRDLSEERHRLLYCGRLVSVKCVDVLIDAFVRIADRRPDWDLVIAGDGALRDALKARVPQALSSRVKWLGFLQFDETVLCYHSCEVLVLPSHFEPWALVINEAVSAGLAVVTTDVVGAAVELVRHRTNGLIVQARNVQAMTDALLEVTTPQPCARMRAAAPDILAQWRRAADPVDGVRHALRHFKLIP